MLLRPLVIPPGYFPAACSQDALGSSPCRIPRLLRRSPALAWSATLASKAQEHANKCRWEHSQDLQANRVGENIVRPCRHRCPLSQPALPPRLGYLLMRLCSAQPNLTSPHGLLELQFYTYGWQYPVDGYDPCGFADVVWASQVAVRACCCGAVSRCAAGAAGLPPSPPARLPSKRSGVCALLAAWWDRAVGRDGAEQNRSAALRRRVCSSCACLPCGPCRVTITAAPSRAATVA